MNEYYKQPVIVLGLLLPLIILVLLVLGMFKGLSTIDAFYKTKKNVYDKAMKVEQQTMKLQGQVALTGRKLEKLNSLIASETRGTFVDHWKEAEQKFTGEELTRSPHSWLNHSAGIGKGNRQPSSQVTMNFSATYRAMQTALMEVEAKLPQMQLDSLTMTPEKDGARIHFTTQFTIWTQN